MTQEIQGHLKNIPEIVTEAMVGASAVFEVLAGNSEEAATDEVRYIMTAIAKLQVIETVLLTQMPWGLEKNRDNYLHIRCHVILDLVRCGAISKAEASVLYPHIPFDEVFNAAKETPLVDKDVLSEAAMKLEESLREVSRAKTS